MNVWIQRNVGASYTVSKKSKGIESTLKISLGGNYNLVCWPIVLISVSCLLSHSATSFLAEFKACCIRVVSSLLLAKQSSISVHLDGSATAL
jgi:hypothetical protein